MSLQFWQSFWLDNHTPWDTQGPHPRFAPLWRMLLGEQGAASRSQHILVPASGRAHEAALLAKDGHKVVAIDLVPEATTASEKLYGNLEHLTLLTGDFYTDERLQPGSFDVVFDRAAWCAMPPELHRRYLERCHALLKPKGYFASIPFTAITYPPERQGPPFAIDLATQVELASGLFLLANAQEFAIDQPDAMLQREAICVWQRTDHGH